MYPDAYLEHWADVYVARGLVAYLSLEQFLDDPHAWLSRIERGTTRPLLRRQQRAAGRFAEAERLVHRAAHGLTTAADSDELDRMVACAREVMALPRHNGAAIEKLHHNRWHRRSVAAMFRPKEA